VTSDHGDEFKEHGYFSHPPQLYDELIHVPLIISGPKLPKNLKVNNLVSILDIPPTILDYLGFEENKDFQGKSLLPLILGKRDYVRHEGIISEIIPIPDSKLISFRTDKWKLILDKEKNTKELFNLVNDPKELVNVYNQYPSIVEFLTQKVQEYNKMKQNMLNKAKEMKKINDILANIKFKI
jgi:arylsulfatase A-like enzyme